ncbi:MAG TPA: D-alanyl-D-alanine carboxypeptidase family protein [Rhizobiaceae bacterium]|nr:D-alanyl-D-alanine carboxypeptidase family protein [Rhizobiaceae bacterium]
MTFHRAATRLAAAIFLAWSTAIPAGAEPLETRAPQAFMVDAETGTILFAKNADKPFPPASLAKLMTMELTFQAIEAGRYTLDDTFVVSENAWRKGGAPSGGSTMFAALKSKIRLGDLIQGVVVQSANDGCIVIAEGIAGSEENFAAMMTERARALGLDTTVLKNSTGLPAEGQVMTARELTQLAVHIWREYPEFYKYYAQREFTWNKITQRNRNPLLALDIGADGMKTGFTEESGYAIVGSVSRNGRRVFATLSGMTSARERAEEARKLLDWGITGFERSEIFAGDEVIGQAQVYGGARPSVALKAQGPIAFLVPTASRDKVTARIVYEGPLVAPVAPGTKVGSLKVWVGDSLTQETPLYTAEAVGVGPLHSRALDAIGELLVGWLR